MKKQFGFLSEVFILLLGIIFLTIPQQANAADIRTGEQITIPTNQTHLKDLYLFGSDIQVNSPTTNDLVTAGGTVNLNDAVSNSLLAAGGTIIVHGTVGNTARIAGGNITIDGPVKNDLLVAGGSVTITKNASIGGDLLMAGGELDVEGPVHGKILMTGGEITLNNTIGGNVNAEEVKTLTLGPHAIITGNLTYSSPQVVKQEAGSSVVGTITYHPIQKHQQQKQQIIAAAAGATLYKLVVDIILSLLLIYFFRKGLLVLFTHMRQSPWKNLGVGFSYAALAPLASVILLILFWLGLASFLFYGLILIISLFLAKVGVGWFLMTWWEKRNKHEYMLDWKAGVVGPVVFLIILWIPILGWLFFAIIYLISIGALIHALVNLIPQLQGNGKKK